MMKMNISDVISNGFLASSSTIARRFTTTLRSFSFRVFFQRFSHFVSDLITPWSLDTWPHNRRALSDMMLALYFKTEKLGLNYTVIFMTDTVIVDFNPLSANPTKWLNTLKQFVGKLPVPVWHRLGSKNAVFDYLRFCEIKSGYCFLSNLHFFIFRLEVEFFKHLLQLHIRPD